MSLSLCFLSNPCLDFWVFTFTVLNASHSTKVLFQQPYPLPIFLNKFILLTPFLNNVRAYKVYKSDTESSFPLDNESSCVTSYQRDFCIFLMVKGVESVHKLAIFVSNLHNSTTNTQRFDVYIQGTLIVQLENCNLHLKRMVRPKGLVIKGQLQFHLRIVRRRTKIKKRNAMKG